ncbi:hypothetical protein OAX78_02130 [Planctomycetota bacterium]|nr:hypothetical protein [Planctomycetota bacterium]
MLIFLTGLFVVSIGVLAALKGPGRVVTLCVDADYAKRALGTFARRGQAVGVASAVGDTTGLIHLGAAGLRKCVQISLVVAPGTLDSSAARALVLDAISNDRGRVTRWGPLATPLSSRVRVATRRVLAWVPRQAARIHAEEDLATLCGHPRYLALMDEVR